VGGRSVHMRAELKVPSPASRSVGGKSGMARWGYNRTKDVSRVEKLVICAEASRGRKGSGQQTLLQAPPTVGKTKKQHRGVSNYEGVTDYLHRFQKQNLLL